MQEYVSIEDIRQAYIDCCKHKTSTDDCVSYQAEAIINNYQLYADLNRLTYEIGPSKVFLRDSSQVKGGVLCPVS